ncbi:DUF6503 family protein, partial [Algibacter miyuki]|uniref:DUF6503 family protein n=1 Tax=Algibacter miyuki TaxID=1306933 RepID=UPI0025B3D871
MQDFLVNQIHEKFNPSLLTFRINNRFIQDITGAELLEKSIQFHDPDNNWKNFEGAFSVTMNMPNKPERISNISISLPKEYFALQTQKDTRYLRSPLLTNQTAPYL